MRSRLGFLFAAASLAACGPGGASAPAAWSFSATKSQLQCGASPFTANASRASLAATFGDKNVVDQIVAGPDGAQNSATVIFPHDPKRRVEILWADDKARARPLNISVSGASSVWTGRGGLRIGASIADAEAINAKSFSLSGFDWDYGGWVTDWAGGKLDRDAQGCVSTVRFSPSAQAQAEGVFGDVKVASDLPALRALKPLVVTFAIGYPAPESAPHAP